MDSINQIKDTFCFFSEISINKSQQLLACTMYPFYTLSHPENDVDVTEPVQECMLQDASLMRQSQCSFLNAWENTQVPRAMTSVFRGIRADVTVVLEVRQSIVMWPLTFCLNFYLLNKCSFCICMAQYLLTCMVWMRPTLYNLFDVETGCFCFLL